VLPRVPRLGLCLSERGALMLSRVPRPSVGRTTEIKKCLVALGTQVGSRVFKACSCVTEALEDVQSATICLYSTASTQLTTPGHGCSGDVTRQDEPRDDHVQCSRAIRQDDFTLQTPDKTSFATRSH
jgi:hypothetical protein